MTRVMTLLAAACAAAMSLPADAETYTFKQTGFSGGAIVSGSFTGADTNGDGSITYVDGVSGPLIDEVTSFQLSFSGNSAAPAFTIGKNELFGLVYAPNVFSVITRSTPQVLLNLTAGGQCTPFCGVLITPSGGDVTATPTVIAAVPEAATWVTMMAGLGLIGATMRRRKHARLLVA